MPRVALLAALSALSLLASCDHGPAVGASPTPTPSASPKPDSGGVCGDGRVIRPGEHCP
jgi:hypothetical protein